MRKALLLLILMVFLYIGGVYLISLMLWWSIAVGGLLIWFGLLSIDDCIISIRLYVYMKLYEKRIHTMIDDATKNPEYISNVLKALQSKEKEESPHSHMDTISSMNKAIEALIEKLKNERK